MHECRDSLSLRDMREESLRLQQTMLLGVSTEEDDEDDGKLSELPPITLVAHRFFVVADAVNRYYCKTRIFRVHLIFVI